MRNSFLPVNSFNCIIRCGSILSICSHIISWSINLCLKFSMKIHGMAWHRRYMEQDLNSIHPIWSHRISRFWFLLEPYFELSQWLFTMLSRTILFISYTDFHIECVVKTYFARYDRVIVTKDCELFIWNDVLATLFVFSKWDCSHSPRLRLPRWT